jgi:NADPH:quinone reductase-like Zn-dependent oxidoreductase
MRERGLRRPCCRVLGSELAGEVEAIGQAVSEFTIGDRVFGVNPWRMGAHAEFVCVRESLVEARRYRAVVDRCYPLEDAVDASRYVETEQKLGNAVLIVDED